MIGLLVMEKEFNLVGPMITAVSAALKAGQAIIEIYNTDFEVETKFDASPLTLADRRSHEIIKSMLMGYRLPMISEEGRDIPFPERESWKRLWIVDPLDGTKEFVKRNGEFTVNIALIENGKPVLGVVFAPIPRLLYFASRDLGAYKIDCPIDAWLDNSKKRDAEELLGLLISSARRLPCNKKNPEKYTIVGSRSHATPELSDFVERMKHEKGQVDFIQAGSSLKICLVAEGGADIYPRLGPTMEWDTAAGQAVAMFAGAKIYDYKTNEELGYNKPNLLNPWFIVERR